MNELEVQKNSALTAPNIQYLPDIPSSALREIEHETISLSTVSALGSEFSSLATQIGKTAAAGQGGSGLYYVNTMGKEMMKFNDGSGYFSALKDIGGGVGGGNARMIPIQSYIDPSAMMMSAALAGISQKMDEIITLQKKIIDYLKEQELAKIIGNINTLSDISNNFRYNWNNKQYKANKHNLVQVIRRDSEQSIILSRTQLKKVFEKNNGISNTSRSLQNEFVNYRLALYQYAFSSYLEVMLLGNFEAAYLDSTIKKIENYSVNWRMLYTDCYNKLEKLSKNSARSHVLSGISKLAGNTGKAIAKLPGISKGPVDEALIAGGEKLSSFNERLNSKPLERLVDNSENGTHLFMENIDTVKKLCSGKKAIMFDNKNMYLLPEAI